MDNLSCVVIDLSSAEEDPTAPPTLAGLVPGVGVGQLFTKSSLLQHCHQVCNAQHREYKIIENRANYFKVNCYSAPKSKFLGYSGVCQFAVFAKPYINETGHKTDHWVVYRSNECHSCPRLDCKHRAHDGRVLMAMSTSLSNFVPNQSTRIGANRQVAEIACVASGIDMKRGQALNVLQKKQNNAVPAHIGQYMLLKSYMELLQSVDKAGTFVTDVTKCPWKKADETASIWLQFGRLYVAFGFAKHVWHNCTCDVVVADGTFTTSGVFKHILLLAVTKDGNNNLVLLAYCICDCENINNWCFFLEHLLKDFRGINVFMSDYDKGVESGRFQQMLSDESIQFSRCVRHMIGNCATQLKVKISEKTKAFVYGMAKSRTNDMNDYFHTQCRRSNAAVAEWFNQRKELFAGYMFLEYGFARNGNVLNNMAEQFNSIIQELRGRPILDLMIGLNAYQM